MVLDLIDTVMYPDVDISHRGVTNSNIVLNILFSVIANSTGRGWLGASSSMLAECFHIGHISWYG